MKLENSKTMLFISHAHPDADVVKALKDLLEDAFGALEVFVSSDSRSLAPGVKWFQLIEESLSKANLFLIVLSPKSITRPWVNFEAGAAFGRNKELIPICIRGLRLHQVGAPLNSYQLLQINERHDVQMLLKHISELLDHRMKADETLMDKAFELAKPRTDDIPPPLTAEAERKESDFLAQMQVEFDSLTMERKVFWETLEAVYADISSSNPDYPTSLNGLIDLATPPVGIPVNFGEHIRDFPSRHARLLSRPSALLWDFCQRIYPPKVAGSTLDKESFVDTSAFNEFHNARALHAKLLNRFGTNIYDLATISLNATVIRFDSIHRILNILTYLELALVQWTQESGQGKQYLFRLNRDWGAIVT